MLSKFEFHKIFLPNSHKVVSSDVFIVASVPYNSTGMMSDLWNLDFFFERIPNQSEGFNSFFDDGSMLCFLT